MPKELTNKQQAALERMMVRYLDVEEKIEELEKQKKEMGSLIQAAMEDAGIKSYPLEFESESGKDCKVTFTVIDKSFINYNEEEIKKIIGKKKFLEIVDRNINIDYEKYANLAKEYKIPYKKAMEPLTIIDRINTRKLEQAYTAGRIDIKDLKGTYTIDKKPYLSHRRMK